MSGLFGGDVTGLIVSRMVRGDFAREEDEELFAVSVRIPQRTRLMLDAMAKQANISRNSMAIELMQAGIQDVLSKLPDVVVQDLVEEAGGNI